MTIKVSYIVFGWMAIYLAIVQKRARYINNHFDHLISMEQYKYSWHHILYKRFWFDPRPCAPTTMSTTHFNKQTKFIKNHNTNRNIHVKYWRIFCGARWLCRHLMRSLSLFFAKFLGVMPLNKHLYAIEQNSFMHHFNDNLSYWKIALMYMHVGFIQCVLKHNHYQYEIHE